MRESLSGPMIDELRPGALMCSVQRRLNAKYAEDAKERTQSILKASLRYFASCHGGIASFAFNFSIHHFGIFQTGIFNMADVSIMTGCALILLQGMANKFRRTHD